MLITQPIDLSIPTKGIEMSKLAATVALTAALMSGGSEAGAATPTIVLVHGAFADSSSWNEVLKHLHGNGLSTVAVANPLRGVQADAEYVSSIVRSIEGPVVLVGHSYGGQVISNTSESLDNVKSLVFVAAFAPDLGEAAADLAGKFPGGTLGEALAPPVTLAGGDVDLYIDQGKFHGQFAHDIPSESAILMAAGQRPITERALTEKSGQPAWKRLPSYFIYGDGDKNIPAQALAYMAERAGSKSTVVVKQASHVVMVSNPKPVADLITEAAQ